MSLPKTFKALVGEEGGKPFVLKELPLKEPTQGQILVKVLACGICHSDGMVRDAMVPLPRIPGHEIIGDVVAVGPGETRWKKGERVGGGWHGGHCFHCGPCRNGDFVLCENANINGVKTDGGYAEYVLLRTEAVVSIPADMDPAETCPMLCAGVTTYNSLRHMNVHAGDIVAVQGIGGLGHLGIQFAAKMGYKVVALSSSPSKKSLAHQLGAHIYLDSSQVNQAEELAKMGGAKVILCTAPHADTIASLMPGVATDGTILLLAIAFGLKIDTAPMIMKRISLRGWPSGQPKDSEDTVAFANIAGIKTMIEKYGFKDIEKGWERMSSGKANFRGVLIPS